MPTRVVMFSGGTGTASIGKAFVAHKNVELTVLVNCYDDGKSTGRLRQFIPGMLGPSDIRKNIARLANRPDLEDREVWRVKEKCGIEWMKTFFAYRVKNGEQAVYLGDCPLGNVLFAGAYLMCKDFNAVVASMQQLYQCPAKILNVTDGENLWLRVRGSDGNLYREGELTELMDNVTCTNILFEKSRGVYRAPVLNGEASHALKHADVIVYGPGTQHSSLLPSYKTEFIGETISNNTKALKVWVGNIGRDTEIKNETILSLQQKTLEALASTTQHKAVWEDFVDRSLVHMGEISTVDLMGAYKLDDWSLGGFHNGEKVVQSILRML